MLIKDIERQSIRCVFQLVAEGLAHNAFYGLLCSLGTLRISREPAILEYTLRENTNELANIFFIVY